MNTLANEAKLALLMPQFAGYVREVIDAASAENMALCIVSGLRTAAEQDALYSQGRTTAGHIVTNAQAGQSMHNYGMAVDVVPYLTVSGPQLNWKAATPQYQRMVALFKRSGLVWGGDWKGDLGDFDHFQIAGLPATPTRAMETIYKVTAPKLDGIWQLTLAGKFIPSSVPATATA